MLTEYFVSSCNIDSTRHAPLLSVCTVMIIKLHHKMLFKDSSYNNKKNFPKDYAPRGSKRRTLDKLQYKNGSKDRLCTHISNRILHRRCLYFH